MARTPIRHLFESPDVYHVAGMYVVVNKGIVTIIEPAAVVSASAAAVIENLGRVKHIIRISGGAHPADVAWVKRFSGCLYWALQGAVGPVIDCILAADSLLPFPGRVLVFERRPEAVIYIPVHELLLTGNVLATNTEWIEAPSSSSETPLALDYERMFEIFPFSQALSRTNQLSRQEALQRALRFNSGGLLTGAATTPTHRGGIHWFILVLFNLFLFFAYIMQKGN